MEQYATFRNLAALYQQDKANVAFIATHLGLSPRHVKRLLVAEEAPKGRAAWNKIADEVREFVIQTKKDYPARNCQWISEMVSDRFETGISQPSVYRILKSQGLLLDRLVNRTPRNRFEAKACGELVQMDTTWGYWLGGRRICLILLLDDYSRYILSAEFFFEDSAANNMRLLMETVDLYGTFNLLYTDNASFFKPIRHSKSMYQEHRQEEYESDITKSCREVGITHITHKPYQPQSKGKVERVFRFIQERFVSQIKPEWHLVEVNTALEEWVSWYNSKHINRTTGCVPKKRFDPKGFRPLSGEKSLEDIFCKKDTRKVDKCNCFSYAGVTYQIPSKHCLVAFRVELHILTETQIRVWHNNEFICQLDWQDKNQTN